VPTCKGIEVLLVDWEELMSKSWWLAPVGFGLLILGPLVSGVGWLPSGFRLANFLFGTQLPAELALSNMTITHAELGQRRFGDFLNISGFVLIISGIVWTFFWLFRSIFGSGSGASE
jgi:hypothetical protein